MERHYDRSGNCEQQLDKQRKPRRIVDVGGAVCSCQQIAARLNPSRLQRRNVGRCAWSHQLGDIDHHIPDQQRAGSKPFVLKIRQCNLRRAEQQLGAVVGQDSVQLLRHRAVEGAHPGLDVDDGNIRLGGRKCTGQCRVGVAVDENCVRLLLCQKRRQRSDHPRSLLAVAASRDLQLDLRPRHPKFIDEDRRKLIVVVLTGMDQHLLVLGAQRAGDCSGLDELRTVADYRYELHAG
ncbi:unannotated protein [freshwater metagenome]|uniref:Unannotated protein n=1 Tax=freshwater metagenome TaxID=449393 RepID=A0A6J5Z7M2_9ZZZZ